MQGVGWRVIKGPSIPATGLKWEIRSVQAETDQHFGLPYSERELNEGLEKDGVWSMLTLSRALDRLQAART